MVTTGDVAWRPWHWAIGSMQACLRSRTPTHLVRSQVLSDEAKAYRQWELQKALDKALELSSYQITHTVNRCAVKCIYCLLGRKSWFCVWNWETCLQARCGHLVARQHHNAANMACYH